MESTEKMRLCPYCEGSVPLGSANCRFCGSFFDNTEAPAKGPFKQRLAPMDYTPPYVPATENIHESVFYPEKDEKSYKVKENDSTEEEEKGHLIALTLLSCGSMLFTLSLLLLFFSEHGRVVLEWKSRYWSLYMILATPMLYYGFKKLKQLI